MISTQYISSYGVANKWTSSFGNVIANGKKELYKLLNARISYDQTEALRQNTATEGMDQIIIAYNGTTLREGGVLLPKLSENIKTVTSFSELKEDWNGNGATPFSDDHIKLCKDFLYKLVQQPDVFPTACDSIQFEFELENGRYLEFEVYQSGQVKRYLELETGEEKTDFFVYPGDINLINKEIESFYA